jgi:hypothetical protein
MLRYAFAPLEFYVTNALAEVVTAAANAGVDQHKWLMNRSQMELVGTVGRWDFAPLSVVIENLRQIGGGN